MAFRTSRKQIFVSAAALVIGITGPQLFGSESADADVPTSIVTGSSKIVNAAPASTSSNNGSVSAQASSATFSAVASSFGDKRIGVISLPVRLTITNSGTTNGLNVQRPVFGTTGVTFGYYSNTSCATVNTLVTPFTWTPVAVAPGQTCTIDFFAVPLKAGLSTDTATITTDAANGPATTTLNFSVNGVDGYYLATASGQLGGYGSTTDQGSNLSGLNRPIVGLDRTSNGDGVWRAASDGGVFATGSAQYFGSAGGTRLNSPVVGITQTGTDKGYWLAAADGGVFSFGDATFEGSMGGTKLNAPIVGIAATPSGKGYWLVASDGGIFSFGDAKFFGSTGATKLNAPVVGMAATSDGKGYWLVASDGGVFAFGDAQFAGSAGATKLNSPVVGIAANALGDGYWLVARDGGVFSFGKATFVGSAGSVGINDVVGLAPTSPQVYLVG